ncbi:hypothetical protein EKG38_12365 [Shewanella canadensis]|uniref:Uncharacterized protein n=1 Tax=Shewanella canadensis TaxID=271096 RepID=A0A431WU11_9GAMM|nr:hypothetical protein [Shewanella canadensis]RTR38937.1 hypothetical protein EKG38_12365 [Shewanella canadensis]
MKTILLASILAISSFSTLVNSAEFELVCEYKTDSNGEIMQLEVTEDKIKWTEITPDDGMQTSIFDRVHSQSVKYAGEKDGMYFNIVKHHTIRTMYNPTLPKPEVKPEVKSVWRTSIVTFTIEGALYRAGGEDLICKAI